MSYHVAEIPKGEFGEISKVVEEVFELQDAEDQNAKIMILNELSDILGAIEGYLQKHHSSITMNDLFKMKELTTKAFISGHRK